MANTDTQSSQPLEQMVKKADRLSDFGTLTSLISTAAYFAENTFVKKLPKWLSVATLSAVGVGIASVVTSYYYKFKAGRMALDSTEACETSAPVSTPAPLIQGTSPGKKWEATITAQATSPQAHR